MTFYYLSGEPVCQGDVVRAAKKPAVVERVFSKGTRDANDFGCFETGGVLLSFEDGDLQLWPFMNEDLEFLMRAEGQS